jgi:hypothetical protein
VAVIRQSAEAGEMSTTEEFWTIAPDAYVAYVWPETSVPPKLVMSTGTKSVVLAAPSTPEELDVFWGFIRALKRATKDMELHLHPSLFWGRMVANGEVGQSSDGG